MDRLDKALEKQGTMQVLRQGFSIAGCGLIEMTEAAPEDRRNEVVIKRYQANILRVVPELKYHPLVSSPLTGAVYQRPSRGNRRTEDRLHPVLRSGNGSVPQ